MKTRVYHLVTQVRQHLPKAYAYFASKKYFLKVPLGPNGTSLTLVAEGDEEMIQAGETFELEIREDGEDIFLQVEPLEVHPNESYLAIMSFEGFRADSFTDEDISDMHEWFKSIFGNGIYIEARFHQIGDQTIITENMYLSDRHRGRRIFWKLIGFLSKWTDKKLRRQIKREVEAL